MQAQRAGTKLSTTSPSEFHPGPPLHPQRCPGLTLVEQRVTLGSGALHAKLGARGGFLGQNHTAPSCCHSVPCHHCHSSVGSPGHLPLKGGWAASHPCCPTSPARTSENSVHLGQRITPRGGLTVGTMANILSEDVAQNSAQG